MKIGARARRRGVGRLRAKPPARRLRLVHMQAEVFRRLDARRRAALTPRSTGARVGDARSARCARSRRLAAGRERHAGADRSATRARGTTPRRRRGAR